jgi:hypothetical protein
MQTLFEQPWKDDKYYQDQWTQFYALRKSLWHRLFIGLLPFAGAMILVMGIPVQWQANVRFLSMALAILSTFAWLFYVVRFFTVGWQMQSWSCPRCGEPFFIGNGVRNPFARHCRHCGLYRPKQSEVATTNDVLPPSL